MDPLSSSPITSTRMFNETRPGKIYPRRQPAEPVNHDQPQTHPTDKALAFLKQQNLETPDREQMRQYRLARIQAQLNQNNTDAILLFDPVNIFYATDSSNMQVWTLHNLTRAAFITANGHITLWDFVYCDHLTRHLPLIQDVRSGGAGAFYFVHGDKEAAFAAKFAHEVKDLMAVHGVQRLAIDRMDISVAQALNAARVAYSPGQGLMERARLIKGVDEIKAMRCAVAACEKAVATMHMALAEGIAEVELWAILHAENIAYGGQWIEGRLLCSGPRTNPWMQEAGGRRVCAGDLLAFDTDMIGLYGYCCDMSRTWLVGDMEPSQEQKDTYRIAYEHIMENMALLAPGKSCRSLTFDGHQLPEAYQTQKYCVKMHGIGLCDEFPSIYYPDHYIEGAVEYELQPGMTLCVEAYVGKLGAREGVKLENQVLITEHGYENITQYPYDKRLLAGAGII